MFPGQARSRFESARVARLATADAAGRPHLVPIVFAPIADALFTVIDAKPKGDPARLRRLRNIRANAAVSVLVDEYDEDWAQLWWARADGTARILDPADPETDEPLDALRARYPQYVESPPPGPLIAIAVDRWSGWTAR
ncbi:MAG TPA: TIGR03668 family PPOX class F420-dependent oxidoreductase [Micromonosporaceae bacterium]|jgi:PPOX class probable F420-dependent enzyme